MAIYLDPKKAKEATPIVLKDMDFHELRDLGRVQVLRVWAGWIYFTFEGSKVVTSVFVPQRGNIEDFIEPEPFVIPQQMTPAEKEKARAYTQAFTSALARGKSEEEAKKAAEEAIKPKAKDEATE